MPAMLLKGRLVCQCYFMFSQGSFAQIQVIVCKQVLPFEQQLPGLVIWSPRSFEPSVTSVATDDLALTFSLASFILLSAFPAATKNWE